MLPLSASPTQGGVPLLQELHFDDLIDRRSVLQFVNESRYQVLVVAREDAQMVSGLVAQALVVVCVEPHQYGGTTAKAKCDVKEQRGEAISTVLSHKKNSSGIEFFLQNGVGSMENCFARLQKQRNFYFFLTAGLFMRHYVLRFRSL